MAQPVSSGQAVRISGTSGASTLVRSRGANVLRVIIPTTKTGTVSLYDAATTAGTAAGNFIMDVQNTAGTVPTSAELGFTTKDGLVAVKGGTTDLVLVVE